MAVEKIFEGLDDEQTKVFKKAIKDSGVKLVDLADGGYVDKNKYTDLETKYNELKDAPNPLVDELAKVKEDSAKALADEQVKLQGVVKKLAIDKEISQLGITDELTIAGIRSLIKVDDIKVDDDYSIKSGLTEQIDALKSTYKTTFEKPQVISTGQSIQTSQTTGTKTGRVYGSLAEIKALSQDEVIADLENIQSQLANLK